MRKLNNKDMGRYTDSYIEAINLAVAKGRDDLKKHIKANGAYNERLDRRSVTLPNRALMRCNNGDYAWVYKVAYYGDKCPIKCRRNKVILCIEITDTHKRTNYYFDVVGNNMKVMLLDSLDDMLKL